MPSYFENLTEEEKIAAVEKELTLKTHMGVTKKTLVEMLRWLWGKFEVTETEVPE